MVTIEDNHELLDIILGYKPDIINDYIVVNFNNTTGVDVSFTLQSPSGTTYNELKTYKLKEVGSWYYQASAAGYSTQDGFIPVISDDFGRVINIDINLTRLSSDVLVMGSGYVCGNLRTLVPINYSIIENYIGHTDNNQYSLVQKPSIVNGYYEYGNSFETYYKNRYYKEGYIPLDYYYKTYNSNIQELNDIRLLGDDYILTNTSDIEVRLIDVTTGNYVQGTIYCKTYYEYGYQDRINPDWDSYNDDITIGNVDGNVTININNNGHCYFTLKFWGDYYAETFVNVTAIPGQWLYEQPLTVYLTSKLKVDGLKAVLTWGSVPNDLDSHIKAYRNGELIKHVFYGDTAYVVDGITHIDLDVDDTSSYGPETISVYVRDDDFMYYYYIYDYSGTDGITSDTSIAIYSEGRLLFTITPDSLNRNNNRFRYWKVFSYNANTQDIRVINKIVEYEPNENNWEE